MAKPSLARTGNDVVDRNFDAIRQHLGDVSVAGKLGPLVALVTGTNTVHPAYPRPSGRVTAYLSDSTVIITDVGLNADGTWTLTASGPCSARFLWLE